MLALSPVLTGFQPVVAAEEDNPWKTISDEGNEINEIIHKNEQTYIHLGAGEDIDNKENAAIFRDQETPVAESDQLKYTVVPKTAADQMNVGFYTHFKDQANYSLVGFDGEVWFYEYKVDGKGERIEENSDIAFPGIDQAFDLEVNYDKFQLTVLLNDETIFNEGEFDEAIEPLFVEAPALKLGKDEQGGSEIYIDQTSNSESPEKDEDAAVEEASEEPKTKESEDGVEETVQEDDGSEKETDEQEKQVTEDEETSEEKETLEEDEHHKREQADDNGELVDIRDEELAEGDLDIIEGDGDITYNDDGSATFHVTSNGKNKVVYNNMPKIKNGTLEADITGDVDLSRFGLIYRVQDESAYTYVGTGDTHESYFGEIFGPDNSWTSFTDGPALAAEETKRLKIRFIDQMARLYIDNEFLTSWSLQGVQEPGLLGFEKSRGEANITISNIVITEETDVESPETEPVPNTLQSDYMEVTIDEVFPRIIQYQVGDKTLNGQETPTQGIKINGIPYAANVSFEKITDNEAEYVLTVEDADENLDVDLVLSVKVEGNQVIYEFTEVSNQMATTIETIEFANLNFISVNDQEKNATAKLTNLSGDINQPGDVDITVDESLDKIGSSESYYVGVLSNDQLSGTIWSSSEVNGHKNLIANRYENDEESKAIGLGSSALYYHRSFMNEPSSNQPMIKIAIAEDENQDNEVDWQDGAIAYRDIMQEIPGWESVNNQVATRIAMNFGSQAQQPFLKTLDNIKKVQLATDNLGQSVLLKGYGNEGHDSAHPDYGDVGERIGGEEDLNFLIDQAHQLNTQVGVHINAQETYPEANAFSEDLIEGPDSRGWAWLDQGYVIDKINDLATGSRAERLDELKTTAPGLDFVYLDVWYQDQWESNRIVEQFDERDLRVTTEFGTAIPNSATWTHWATDKNYGGTESKGINSDLLRFISNHQRDSWVLNWPEQGGTADHPLLGGYELFGFEGWQSDKNFDNFINKTFDINLPTKFLQKYRVMNWETVDGDPTETNLEQEIKLEDPGNDDTVVVKRKNNGRERVITLNDHVILDGSNYLLPWIEQDFQGTTPDSEKLYHWNKEGGETTWDLPNEYLNENTMKVYQLTDQGRVFQEEVEVVDNQITIAAEASTPYLITGDNTDENTDVAWSEEAHVYDTGFNSGTIDDRQTELEGDLEAVDVKRTETEETGRQYTSGDYFLSMENPTETTSFSRTISGLEPGQDYVAEVYVENQSDAKAYIEVDTGAETASNVALKSLQKNYVKADSHASNDGLNSKMQRMQVSFTAEDEVATLSLTRDEGEGVTKFDDIRIVEKSLDNYDSENVFEQDFETVVQGIYPFVIGNTEGVEDNRIHLSEKNAPYTQKGWANAKEIDDVIDGDWSVKVNTGNSGLVYRTIPQHFSFDPGSQYEVSFDYQTTADSYRFIVGDQAIDEQSIDNVQGLSQNEQLEASTDTNRVSFTVDGSENGQTYVGIFSDGTTVDAHTGEGNFILDNLRIEKLEEKAPILEVKDMTISVGDSFDLQSLIVKALDSKGEDVTENVKIDTGDFDNETPGEYVVTFTLEEEGYEARMATASVTVEDVPVDKGELQSLIAAQSDKDKTNYTAESWEVFAQALSEAESVLADSEASQENVDHALFSLQEAEEQLESKETEKVDKTALQELVDAHADKEEAEYTKESWTTFIQAMAQAKEVLAEETASQKEIDLALTELQTAIDGLTVEEKTDESDGDNHTEGNDEPDDNTGSTESGEANDSLGGDSGNNQQGDELPDTATSTFNWLITGLLFTLIGLVIGYFEWRRKAAK
uniref:endo-alpha-N-acetylgalactosaminidase family protein n=1 Tax=Gracilibacillus timonensis TaxID=1816696 RepID=UPI003709A9CA